jgi:hypothetical protein
MTRARDVATQGGLVKIASTNFTSATTVNVNNVFNSTFDNYRILIESDYGSDGQDLRMKLRVAGADDSSNYSTASWLVDPGGQANTGEYVGTSGWKFESTNKKACVSMDLFRPALAITTAANASHLHLYLAQPRMIAASFFHNVSTAYDGFTLIWQTANTGKVHVFGYRK